MEELLKSLKAQAAELIQKATDLQALQDARVKFLGKKGEVTALLKGLGKLSAEERPRMGALVNTVRQELEAMIDDVQAKLEAEVLAAKLGAEEIDITLPGRATRQGHVHPLTAVNDEIERFFMKWAIPLRKVLKLKAITSTLNA